MRRELLKEGERSWKRRANILFTLLHEVHNPIRNRQFPAILTFNHLCHAFTTSLLTQCINILFKLLTQTYHNSAPTKPGL